MRYKSTLSTLIIAATVYICLVSWVTSGEDLSMSDKGAVCLLGFIVIGIPVAIAAFNDTYKD